MSGWSCLEDVSMMSFCTLSCGNSVWDSKDNEQCDDGNLANNDGCSKKCKVESGWECSGGNDTTFDTCIKWPKVEFVSISESNYVVVQFSDNMEMNMLEDDTFEIHVQSLDGKTDYTFDVEYEWISSNEIGF